MFSLPLLLSAQWTTLSFQKVRSRCLTCLEMLYRASFQALLLTASSLLQCSKKIHPLVLLGYFKAVLLSICLSPYASISFCLACAGFVITLFLLIKQEHFQRGCFFFFFFLPLLLPAGALGWMGMNQSGAQNKRNCQDTWHPVGPDKSLRGLVSQVARSAKQG